MKQAFRMPTLIKLLSALLLLLLLATFGFLAITDVPVIQEDVTKQIPEDRFLSDK